MDRLTQTARIVEASLKNNPHTKVSEVPDLIKAVYAALPNIAVVVPTKMSTETIVEPEQAEDIPGGEGDGGGGCEAPVEPVEGADSEEAGADAPVGKVSWQEAMATSRARFGNTDGVKQDEVAEAEVEAHAS